MEFDSRLLIYAAPVALAALGETINQRAGVLNIGLEGIMLTSAFFGMLGTLATQNPWAGLMLGALAGLLLGLIQAFFTLNIAADQVVVGTAVNLFGLGLTSTLFQARFGGGGQLISVPTLPSWVGNFDAVILLLFVLPILIWIVLHRTGFGLTLRAAGEYPRALEAAGTSVLATRWAASGLACLLAGLGGAYLAVGTTGTFAMNMTAGRGFIAIAMVTFGRWNPFLVLVGCLLVGYTESLQYSLQARGTGLPPQLFTAMPYLVALVVLIVIGQKGRRGSAVPAALGIPFRRSES